MSDFTAIVLAAGKGTRMRSQLPKVLHPICGKPMILWPIEAARAAGAREIVVVQAPRSPLASVLPPYVKVAIQADSDGTGGAVKAALEHIDPSGASSLLLVLSGDVPLVDAPSIADLLRAREAAQADAVLASAVLDDPAGYGRIVRDTTGSLAKIVETKLSGDATPAELAITEVNAGIYVFQERALEGALARLRRDNAQGELYLTDALQTIGASNGCVVVHRLPREELMLGVNDRVQLAQISAIAQRAICERHMLAGVTIRDPANTVIDAQVQIGEDAYIEPGVQLLGATTVGANAIVGAHTVAIDSHIGAGAKVLASSLHGARVMEGAEVGPFAYLRPGAALHPGAKAGTFVEIKNANIGAGAKVPHLSYIGDADVGERSNLGAGTITANYDGDAKHRTIIGADVHGGVHSSLVAPVKVGDEAYTGAGSVITKDVPKGALGIARARQVNLDGYASRKRRKSRPS